MRKSVIAFATGAVVAVAAVAIVASSFAHRIDDTFSTIKVPASTAAPVVSSPTPSVAVKPIEGDTNGDGRLSEFEKEVLAKSRYTLPDGSVVKLVDGQPLPASVQAAVTSAITPALNTYRSASMSTNAQYVDGVLNAISDQESKTGKTIIVVYSGPSPAGRGWFVSETSIDAGSLNGFASQAAAVAAVEAYTEGDPSFVEIVTP